MRLEGITFVQNVITTDSYGAPVTVATNTVNMVADVEDSQVDLDYLSNPDLRSYGRTVNIRVNYTPFTKGISENAVSWTVRYSGQSYRIINMDPDSNRLKFMMNLQRYDPVTDSA